METSVILGLMYNMKSRIRIFEGNKNDGIFSRNPKFYKDNATKEEIESILKETRIKLGNKYGFSGLKMFEVTQKMEDNDSYPDNKAIILDDTYMQVEDYYMQKILADILILPSKYKRVAVTHRMADCPVIIAEDRKLGYTALAHCGIYHINRGLPKEIIKSLIDNCNSNPKDIYVYIGSHIKKDSYIYDTYPKKATNELIWKDAITENNGKYYIDLAKAITNQLIDYSLGEIKISKIDTAKDINYASHKEACLGNKDKLGQNIVGFYYE